MTYKKKLIEVALPLEAINEASAKEKSIRHGHPSTLHLWWARRPLAACRAVLFASLVDDPSSLPEEFPTEKSQKKERKRLFGIIAKLVKWENINNKDVLDKAKKEILKSTDGNPPPVLDPFCGGGSIPLEAQRLGLEAYGSDLNPVAVIITKALIEIPPKFAGRPPVNPVDGLPDERWQRAAGLAADVRYYGKWMREEAKKRIGHLYPKVKLPKELGGKDANVVAWIWTRTAKCPNPGCGAEMPLASTFWLSKKKNQESWIKPVIDKKERTVVFEVESGGGGPPDPPKVGRGGRFRCLVCDSIAEESYLREKGHAGEIGTRALCAVAKVDRKRVFLPPGEIVSPTIDRPDFTWLKQTISNNPRWFSPPGFGFPTFHDLFTSRQLILLSTFCDLVGEARQKVIADGIDGGLDNEFGGQDDKRETLASYADAVATYLGFGVSRLSDIQNSLCMWENTKTQIRHCFTRQALPMLWDFAEAGAFSDAAGDFATSLGSLCKCIEKFPASPNGYTRQLDARTAIDGMPGAVISTDPPYYDNIGYADLSDFFYVWLRRSLAKMYPQVFSTLLTPKSEELIASPFRHEGDKAKAEEFFEQGLADSFLQIYGKQNQSFPMTLFYAFKQAESKGNGDTVSTGWETMLEGLMASGFAITGTWPMRSELSNRPVARGTNALASSIVLACRPRPDGAPITTRRDFLTELRHDLPTAIGNLQQGNIAPVDLAQAVIGPGMAVFSKYVKVIESDGNPMTVHSALSLINQVKDDVLEEASSDWDAYTRWALDWFKSAGMDESPFGDAETLATARAISVSGVQEAGIIKSRAGKVRLLKRSELQQDWDPAADKRLTVWEVTQYLIRALDTGGEREAASLAAKVGAMGEDARDLAYRLYTICERKKWAQEALAYNSLVVAWPEITRQAGKVPVEGKQTGMEI